MGEQQLPLSLRYVSEPLLPRKIRGRIGETVLEQVLHHQAQQLIFAVNVPVQRRALNMQGGCQGARRQRGHAAAIHECPGRLHDPLQVERAVPLARATDLALSSRVVLAFGGHRCFI